MKLENRDRDFRYALVMWLLFGALALSIFLATPALAMETPDPWITTKVKISLLTADGVPATAINVDTVDGRVTLHGIVSSDSERTRAEAVAREIQGVRVVQNLLQVVPSSHKEAVRVSDAELRKNVEAVLSRDQALETSRVKVASVHDGVVLLSGRAETLSAHKRALEDARAVPGVKKVSSEIESPDRLGDQEIFRGATGDGSLKSAAYDTWLTSAVKARLLAASDVPALSINVDTSDSVVTLFGSVPTPSVKHAAELEAKKVDGVRAVRNELQIVPEVAAQKVEESDSHIRDAIAARLKARSELSDGDIEVEVEKGVARLTGSVATQSDRMLATTTTRGVRGVRAVIDDLQVTPPATSSS